MKVRPTDSARSPLLVMATVLVLALAAVVIAGCSGEVATTTTAVQQVLESTSTGPPAASLDPTTSSSVVEHQQEPEVDLEAGPLSEEERQALLYLREEEKLARDVYLALYEEWGTQVFQNISESEIRHMESMKLLLDNYGLEDPVVDDTPGVFTDGELQQLYDDLVHQGGGSKVEALNVGVAIETKDIADLEELLSFTTHADIKQVAESLLNGSKNHLAAFSKQL